MRSERSRFDPLWLLDAAGVLGFAGFAWLALRPALPPPLDPGVVRDLALAIAILALGVRILDLRARARARIRERRGEALRRLVALDDALMDLRRSLSREAARRFVERRAGFQEVVSGAGRWLSPRETGQAADVLAFCGRLTEELADAIRRRAAIASLAYRLRQEISRAGRLGEAPRETVDELCALVEDACAVMDEALYAEWNADHFGRLAAVQRCFARVIERCEGEVVRNVDEQAARLFEQLNGHLREKVRMVEALQAWDRTCRDLETALGGLGVRQHRPAAPAQRVAERFALAPAAGPRPVEPVRLPAAND